MATYCVVADLLLGDLATSALLSPQQFVQDGSDEIDMCLGYRYVTPIVTAGLPAHTILVLKRINIYLATGRFMIQAYAGDTREHATGKYYLTEAQDALKELEEGKLNLEGVANTPAFNDDSGTGPLIQNEDTVSMVEGYYNSTQLGKNAVDGSLGVLYPYPAPSLRDYR